MIESIIGLLACLALIGATIWLVQRVRDTERTPPQGVTPGTGSAYQECATCGFDRNTRFATRCQACGASLMERSPTADRPPAATTQRSGSATTVDGNHVEWLLGEMRQAAIWAELPDSFRMRIREHYVAQLTSPTAPGAASPADTVVTPPAASKTLVGSSAEFTFDAPPPQQVLASAPKTRTTASAPASPFAVPQDPPPPPSPPRPRPWETWDPAVTLLYLGAFLVVSSGLFYASFNWSGFSDAARLGLLVGVTLAFLLGGTALLAVERVRPAAVAFIGIGALLVPMNGLAIWNIVAGAASRPALTLALGAATTGLLYGILSFRPGGIVYRYGTVVAGAITAFAVPPMFGADWRWGATFLTLLSATALDAPRALRGRYRRFVAPVVHVGVAAAIVGPLVVLGLTDDMTGTSFTVAAMLAALTIALGRFAIRKGSSGLAIGALMCATFAPFSALLDADAPDRLHALVAAALGAAAVVLHHRGPALLRLDGVRLMLAGYAPTMFAIAVAIAVENDESALVMLIAGVAAAGMIVLGRFWAQSGWLYVAIAFATVSWLALETLVPHGIEDPRRSIVTFGLWAMILAVTASVVQRRAGDVWSLPPLLGAATFAALTTSVQAADLWDNGQSTERLLTLTIVATIFATGSWLAGMQHESHLPAIPAAIWTQMAVWAPMFLLPVGDERLWPLLAIASAGILVLGAAIHVRFRPSVLEEPLLPGGIITAAGSAPLLLMLQLTARYVLGFPLDDAFQGSWWTPYLAFFVGSAAILVAVGVRSGRAELALPVTGLTIVSVTLLLRMTLDDRSLEIWTWLPAVAAISAAIAGLAWLGRSGAGAFRSALDLQIAIVAAAVTAIALGGMLIASCSYVISGSAISTQLDDGIRPWWTYLATFAAGAAITIVTGWRVRRPELSPVATVLTVSTIALAVRMASARRETDVWDWLPFAAIAGFALAVGMIRLIGRNAFATSFGYQLGGAGALVGLVAWAASIGAIAVYVGDRTEPFVFRHSAESLWWLRYEAMLAATIAMCLVIGRRRQIRLLAWPLVGTIAVAIVLALRMITTDLSVWTWAGGVVGLLLWLGWLREWLPAADPFDRDVRDAAIVLGALSSVATVGLNGFLVWWDDAGAWSGTVIWATIGLVSATTALVRGWYRLVYGAIAAGWIALGFTVAALDLALADGGILFAGYAWVLALAGLTLAQRPGIRPYSQALDHGAIAVALSPIALALTVSDAWDPTTTVYARLTLAVFSLAGIVTVGAIVHRDARRGIAASVVAMIGVMMQVAAQEPANIQAFTVPLGLYALALGWLRRRQARIFDALTTVAALLLIGPPLVDSFGGDAFAWWLVAGGIALGFVAYGIVLAHRTPLAAGIVGITILVGRQLFDAVNVLPTWIVLGLVGIALLTIGTVWVGYRDPLASLFGRLRTMWDGLR